MKIGNLFIGVMPCNDERRFILASYAYVTGYWRWSLSYYKPNELKHTFKWPLFGPSYNSGKMYSPGKGHFGMWFVIPLIGSFSLTTQPRMDSMKSWA